MPATAQEDRATVRQQTVQPREKKYNYKDERDVRQKQISCKGWIELSPGKYNYFHDLAEFGKIFKTAFILKLFCETLFRHSTGANVHNPHNNPTKYRKCYAPGENTIEKGWGTESISAMLEKTLGHVTVMAIFHWLWYARAPTNCLGSPHTGRQGPTRCFEI